MKCQHCLQNFHGTDQFHPLGEDKDAHWFIKDQVCPACNRLIIYLVKSEHTFSSKPHNVQAEYLIHPRGSHRPPCPKEVPPQIAEDYNEACLVAPYSPKASAALSRRCLQHLLRETAGVKHGNLANEIDEVIRNGKLPQHLIDSIDAIRNIGNFSAHPMKSTQTGDILPVEPHEAEWNLDVLESLFDFYYVQPAVIQAKRDALNQKLAEAGKPPMK